MSWEIRLTPWSIVISVFSPMRNLPHSELSWRCSFFFSRSCSHTVYGCMWISPGMAKVCIRSQSFRMGSGRSKIYLLSLSKSIRGEADAGRCLEALSEAIVRYSLNFLKNVLCESTSRLPLTSRETSARAEDPIIRVSTRRWHRRNVRTNYFWKHECLTKSLMHFKTDNFDLFLIPVLPQLPYRSDTLDRGDPGEEWVWGSSTASLKKNPSEDKKRTL